MTSTRNPAPEGAASVKKGVLLVDDHPFMRAGLALLVNKQPDLTLAGEAGTAAEAISIIERSSIDLVLSDITMPGRGGIEFIKDVQVMRPDLPILVVSMHDELLYAERVLRAGARGYIMKEAGGENLLAAIRQVLNGEVYVSPRVSARILESVSGRRPRGSTSPIEKLTDREIEIFEMIGAGKNPRQIASELNLSTKTVDVHRANIREKLQLPDSTALVRHAVHWVETRELPK